MNVRNKRPAIKRPENDKGKIRPARRSVRRTKWEAIDERLDEALRYTFPASDALSIVQTVRDS
jgi:hypothetical protein